jgi:hypothetical protein
MAEAKAEGEVCQWASPVDSRTILRIQAVDGAPGWNLMEASMAITITDEQMRAAEPTGTYTAVILKDGPNRHADGADAVIEEHGRSIRQLRADGLLSIVCAVDDDTEVDGIGIFDLDAKRTRDLMDVDPGVRAGIFDYEVHPVLGYPGDALPG